MNRLITLLVGIIFIQLSIFLYIYIQSTPTQQPLHKVVKKELPSSIKIEKVTTEKVTLEELVKISLQEIVKKSRQLPKPTDYTVWDDHNIGHICHKIMQRIAPNSPEENNSSNIRLALIHQPTPLTLQPIKTSSKTFQDNNSTIALEQKSKKVETYAKRNLGKKYVWGATGPNKFDCSGFTQAVFRSTTGIHIPRVSRDQAKFGKYIKYENLKRGDMVFFDTEHKFTGRVNHVGIYLSDGKFIHASSARKKVIITSFKRKPFYKKRFLWGRRVINSNS